MGRIGGVADVRPRNARVATAFGDIAPAVHRAKPARVLVRHRGADRGADGREDDGRAPATVRMAFMVYAALALWALIGGAAYVICALWSFW